MKEFNALRDAATDDELWLLEHPAVFTRGVSCTQLPHCNRDRIPLVDTDRGGQITYHGPGQLVVYMMFDIRRRGQGVKRLVSGIEQAVIDTLAGISITAERRARAPGVYVKGRKIAALGLRVRSGYTCHGLSLNIDMDLEPFTWIDPCGLVGLETVNITDLVSHLDREALEQDLSRRLMRLVDETTNA
jgi:lipoyl(octanoyl) transferase